MISIRKSAEDIDRLEELLALARGVYIRALQSAGEYAIEIEPGQAGELRTHLDAIQAQAESAVSSQDWALVQASFRGELRLYRDDSRMKLVRLRGEIAAAAEAMRVFADNVAAAGEDYKAEMSQALQELNALASLRDLTLLDSSVRAVHGMVQDSFERMEQRHRMVIAQLRDEIRLLHEEVERERQAAFRDEATGVWNRPKLESLFTHAAEQDEPFCAVLVSVRNVKMLETRYSRPVIDAALKALLNRFAAMLEEDAVLGRWDEDVFAAMLNVEPSAALGISKDAARRLSSNYSVQDNGLARSVPLMVVTGVIDRQPGLGYAVLRERLEQMSETLSRG